MNTASHNRSKPMAEANREDSVKQPRYLAIKRYIRAQIENYCWPVNFQVPSENQLAQEFAVSRMTARRALSELTDEGLLARTQGLGTFVAEPVAAGSLLEVRNIADEISAQGHNYTNRILQLTPANASARVARALGLCDGATVFYSVIVHLDNALPVQWEERYTNPALAPDYLQQDFSSQTPNAYLSRVAPLTGAETRVEAISAGEDLARALEIAPGSACLQVWRRTKSHSGIASFARLVHPGSRYRLGAQLEF